MIEYKIKNVFLWGIIFLYVAVLPYAIILFNYLESLLTLPALKIIPLIVIMFIGVSYVFYCRSKENGYYFKSFILPSILFLSGVVVLEKNTIKYLHIPEYLFLTWLIYFALPEKNDQAKIRNATLAFFSACLLGLVDEVHHGIHPARYFGWKDMIINAVGALIGLLLINIVFIGRSLIYLIRDIPNQLDFLRKYLRWQSLFLSLSLLIAGCSLFALFEVAEVNDFNACYPIVLYWLNLLCIISSIVICQKLVCHAAAETVILLLPIIILCVLHALIVYSYFMSVDFQ